MKKNLVFCFLLFFLHLSSQKYTFDYFLIYTCENIKPGYSSYINQTAVNSSDKSYILYVFQNGIGKIFDAKNNNIHVFKISKNEDQSLIFDYQYSKEILLSNNEGTIISARKIAEDYYVLENFFHAKKKRSQRKITVKLKKSPLDLLILNADISESVLQEMLVELKESVGKENNYIIEEAIIDYRNGNIFKNKLVDFHKINLTLEPIKQYK